jgi:hypothetical protein
MAGSGSPSSVTFTPPVACDVIVTATFQALQSGSDWGAGGKARLFLTQNAVTTYSDQISLGTARQSYSLTYKFAVAAGLSVTCGLWGEVTGAASVTFYNAQAIAEEIRR